jgi:hypothetical protein
MLLPSNFVNAVYCDPGAERYKGNPLIEALPPIMSVQQIKKGLTGKVEFNHVDVYADSRKRAHIISALLDDFFQPIRNHLQLEEKISIMIRSGYVGRNLSNGSLNRHMQNGYERIMSGKIDSFRFAHTRSTARSLSLIGCSGSGKSSTVNRILATYPQAIFHEKYNFTQLSYLRIECPNNGSLKSLCLNFFREVDRVLHTNYEQQYGRNRHGQPALLALMSQVATHRAIGILVIDEIQRLKGRRSAGQDVMLEFFVELVNTVGVPVILVGTPKARPIFELELQSGRRSAGFGSLFWEPMRATKPLPDCKTEKVKRTEWVAFTDTLWKYQWLQNRDEVLSDEIRDCWYDLSQGVLDIVVKLFVLAQLRAIATGLEKINVKLLRHIYDEELKPVHPMLAALRSGDPELIAKYSDLHVQDIDKKILELHKKIDASQLDENSDKERFGGNEQALRLYSLLMGMDCRSDLLVPLIEKVFVDHPRLAVREMITLVLEWYENLQQKQKNAPLKSNPLIREKNWHTLETDDIRFTVSQGDQSQLYEVLKSKGTIFDFHHWLNKAG